jgi:norsolorinic acid ketoreductase
MSGQVIVITKVDILISNAGLMGLIAPTLQTPAQVVRDQFEVNTIGPLSSIQAFFPLLEKSEAPKFLVLTSSIGSIGDTGSLPMPFFGYGLSKAAANYLVRKLHFENSKLTSMAFNPGWVQTDMGNGAATSVGMEQAPMTIDESVKNLIGLFDEASREKEHRSRNRGRGEITHFHYLLFLYSCAVRIDQVLAILNLSL